MMSAQRVWALDGRKLQPLSKILVEGSYSSAEISHLAKT